MKKKLLTAAIAAAMIAPLAANAAGGPTVYGVAHASIESLDVDSIDDPLTGLPVVAEKDFIHVKSRQSRLGVKGSEDLGNGLKAIYKMEFQIDIADENGASNLVSRNQYVGLAGNWGTFLLGRHDTPVKMMTISRDKFNTTLGDWNEVGFSNLAGAAAAASASANAAILAATGVAGTVAYKAGNAGVFQDNRTNNAIMYISPNMNGFTAAAQVSPGETNNNDGIDDATRSLAAKYVNGPIFVGAGYEENEDAQDIAGYTDDWERWRLAASYQLGDFNLGAAYEDHDGYGFMDGVDGDVWQVSASFAFGNNVVKATYQEAELDMGTLEPDYDTFSIGADHNFSKRTRAYAVYTDTSVNGDAELALMGADWDSFGVGLVHKF